MNLKILLMFQEIHSQVHTSGEHIELDQVIALRGQSGEIDMGVSIDPEIVFSAKMNFCPSVSGSELVIHDDRKIDRTLLISHIRRSLYEHIACYITHPRKAIVIVFRTVI